MKIPDHIWIKSQLNRIGRSKVGPQLGMENHEREQFDKAIRICIFRLNYHRGDVKMQKLLVAVTKLIEALEPYLVEDIAEDQYVNQRKPREGNFSRAYTR